MRSSLHRLIGGTLQLERQYRTHVHYGRMNDLYREVCEYDEKRTAGTLTAADVPPDRSRFMAQPYVMNDAEFNVFWEAYDLNIGKEAAHKAWKRLHPADREKARKAAGTYAEANPDKRFRKSPAAWLAGCCWNDEIVDRTGRQIDLAELTIEDTEMSKEGALQFFPTDLAPDLDPLSMEERGMYLTYVRQAWPYGGPMPVDEVEAVIGKPWLSTGSLFQRRFTVEGGVVTLPWLEEKRAKSRAFSEVQAAKGRLGGRPSKGEKPEESSGLTKASPNKSPRDGNGKGIGIEEREPAREFEPAWEAYGRHGNKLPAHKAWAKLTNADRDACLAAIPAYVKATNTDGNFPSRKNFSTYLNERAWEDAVPAARSSTNGAQKTGTWHKDRQGLWVAPSGRTEDELQQVEKALLKERGELSAEDLKAVDEEAWHWSYKLNGT